MRAGTVYVAIPRELAARVCDELDAIHDEIREADRSLVPGEEHLGASRCWCDLADAVRRLARAHADNERRRTKP